MANYTTIDYLPDLTSSEKSKAIHLYFEPLSASSNEWDNDAYYGTSQDYALLNSTFRWDAVEGATYDIASFSYFDPFLIEVYDGQGNVIATTTNEYPGDYDSNDMDAVWDFVAPYTGTYYVSAGWDQGSVEPHKYVSLAIYENIDTALFDIIRMTTAVKTGTAADEWFVGTSANNTINGAAGNDVLDGGSGADKLLGGAGNDALRGGLGNDSLNGDSGTDKLFGGLGNDTYIINSLGDSITEYANEGTDTVQSSVTINLTANAERLTLTGVNNINGTGNNLNNVITGNSGNNILNGGAGSDVINGGLGNDKLIGGTGVDYFVFNTALNSANKDTINDFNVVDDTIKLENAIMSGLGLTTGTLASTSFWRGAGVTTAHDANDHILYNTTTGNLYYDADGTGSAKAVQIATIGISSHPALAYTDFMVA